MLALTLAPDGCLLLSVPASTKPQTIEIVASRKTRLSITCDRSVVIERLALSDDDGKPGAMRREEAR